MDTQNKISVFVNGELAETIDCDALSSMPNVFSAQENNDIMVQNNAMDYDVVIEVGEDISITCEQRLTEGEFTTVNKKDNPHPPLKYSLVIIDKKSGRKYFKYYSILPLRALKNHQYNTLIEEISNYNSQWILDETSAKHTSSGRFSGFEWKRYKSICASLHENKASIISALERVFKNPEHRIVREILKQPFYGKQNQKTIIKNSIYGQKQYYNLKSGIDYDIPINRWLKHNLLDVFYKLSTVLDYIEKENKKMRSEIENGEQVIIQGTVSDCTIEAIRNINASKNARIANNEDLQNSINDIRNAMIKVIESENFSLIASDTDVPHPRFNNRDYLLLKQNVVDCVNSGSCVWLDRILGTFLNVSLHKTSKLFEYYCFCIIVDCLIQNGFLFADDATLFNQDTLLPETTAYLSFDDSLKAEVCFDKKALDVGDFADSGLYSINSQKNNPDIYVRFYNDKNKTIYLIVIDAKCRKYEDVKKNTRKSNGNLYETVKDYLSLRYLDKLPATTGKMVDSLIFLCPGEESKCELSPILGNNIQTLLIDGMEDAFSMKINNIICEMLGANVSK